MPPSIDRATAETWRPTPQIEALVARARGIAVSTGKVAECPHRKITAARSSFSPFQTALRGKMGGGSQARFHIDTMAKDS
jgi:hypothetical protein